MDNTIYNFGAFVLPVITNTVVLYFALAGYRRTKHRMFGVWVVVSILGFIDILALYGLRDSKSPSDHHALWLFWSLESIVAGLFATYGIILLMRYALSHTTKIQHA